MESYNLNFDIKEVITDKNIPWSILSNCTVVVTGSSGLLGSLIVNSLYQIVQLCHLDIKVLAITRSPLQTKKKLGIHNNNVIFLKKEDLVKFKRIDYIIHCAAPTDSFFFVSHPVEVISGMLEDAFFLLNLGLNLKVRRFLQLSSLEVYGTTSTEFVDEDTWGALNPFSVRSSYSESKRLIETLCRSYYEEYGLDTVVARLAQCFGAGVDLDRDKRVFADFVSQARNKKKIQLLTRGQTCRSYVYSSDAVRALFYILLKAKAGTAYNIANPENYCSILEMANLVGKMLEVGVEITPNFEETKKFCPEQKINMDISKLSDLGWTPRVSLNESFRRMITNSSQTP